MPVQTPLLKRDVRVDLEVQAYADMEVVAEDEVEIVQVLLVTEEVGVLPVVMLLVMLLTIEGVVEVPAPLLMVRVVNE